MRGTRFWIALGSSIGGYGWKDRGHVQLGNDPRGHSLTQNEEEEEETEDLHISQLDKMGPRSTWEAS